MAPEGTSLASQDRKDPTLLDRFEHYGTKTVEPVRTARAQVATDTVPYRVQGREIRISPKLLSYWIPFLVGVGLMVGGMKTAGVPLVGIPQLILGVALIALTAWDYVTDSGRLDVKPPSRPSPPAPGDDGAPPTVEWSTVPGSGRTYAEEFRHNAVETVRTSGKPVAVVARELDISPSTLAKWVNDERQARAERGEPLTDDTLALPAARRSD